MMKQIKHSKFKNTAIIYELLMRQVAVDIMENVNYSVALKILQKYFNKNKYLYEELQLYNFLKDKHTSSEIEGNHYIDSILKIRNNMSEKKLRKEKYNIIKEIKQHYNVDHFFSTPLKNYKVLASIYKLFENSVNSNKYNYNPTNAVSARYVIIENMINPKILKNNNKQTIDSITEKYKKQDKDIRALSYKLLIERFNNKYGKLNKKQRILLKKYIDNLANTNQLKEYIETEIPIIKKQFKKIINEKQLSNNNKILTIKLNEICKQLDNIYKYKFIKDKHLLAMLNLYELLEECKKIKENN